MAMILRNGQSISKKMLGSYLRFIIARIVASCFFLTAALMTIVGPAALIAAVIFTEISTQDAPVSEGSDAVGAWGSWLSALLIIIGAVINKYN